ncbi:hypothetical protein [Succinimonas amylolytica]|uniref:hypothetical protein n=1 Tax=Succinimonas amylolytica TaxID=83769 RepID=UPI0003A5F444|nr:hypothetical protein [Succinimonas amylolytica]
MAGVSRPCYIVDWRDLSASELMEKLQPLMSDRDYSIFIVNDRNSEEELTGLKKIIGPYKQIILIQRVSDSSPYAAICDGFREANTRGFSHAYLWVPECQLVHEDVMAMWSLAQEHPENIIAGVTQLYIDPRTRRERIKLKWYKRDLKVIKNFNFEAPVRIYPVGIAYECMQKHNLGTLINFHAELFIRLCWAGVHYSMKVSRAVYVKKTEPEASRFADCVKEFRNQFNFFYEKVAHKKDVKNKVLF